MLTFYRLLLRLYPHAFQEESMGIVLRTQGEPTAMTASMRRADPQQPLFEISTVVHAVARRRLCAAAVLVGVFSAANCGYRSGVSVA